jgi:hypothetical protein
MAPLVAVVIKLRLLKADPTQRIIKRLKPMHLVLR